MKKFFSFLVSRQMLAIVIVLVTGLTLWVVGPHLTFAGLRPLAPLDVRITFIILLLALLLCLCFSWNMHFIGITALCLLIWYGGPLLMIGATQPLASSTTRMIIIGIILFMCAVYIGYLFGRALREGKKFLALFLGTDKNQSIQPTENQANSETSKIKDDIGQQGIKAIQDIFQHTLIQLKAMRTGDRGIRRLFESKRYLYELPWYMLIGMPDAGKTTVLANAGLKFPFAAQIGAAATALTYPKHTPYCDWWLTNEGVFIDTAGEYVKPATGKHTQTEWQSLLGLLRKHRTRAPINGAIVTLNAAALLTQSHAERLAHIAVLRERLVELRNTLGIRFPVYVIVTKMDVLEGFTEYFQALTKEGCAQVWGFTLPHIKAERFFRRSHDADNQATTLKTRLQTESQILIRRLEDGLAARLQEEFDLHQRRALYALPQAFSGMMPLLIEMVDGIFQSSLYDSTELTDSLRGVYFTSAAQTKTKIATDSLTLLQRLRFAISSSTSKAANTLATADDATADEGLSDQSIVNIEQSNIATERTIAAKNRNSIFTPPSEYRSYFLFDLLTKVIIPEAYLVRPNLRWEFRFRLLRLLGHLSALVIFLWLVSALFISFNNNHHYLKVVADKTIKLKQQINHLFVMPQAEKMLVLPDTLHAAQVLPMFQGLNLENPSGRFSYGLYSAPSIITAAQHTYTALQDNLLLPQIIERMETVLKAATHDRDEKVLYDTLRVYLQLHDKTRYNADDIKAWVQKDWTTSDGAIIFGGRSAMLDHVNALFSGHRVVQSPFLQNEGLIQAARQLLNTHPSTQRLYERAKAAMQHEAPQAFSLIAAVGPQAGTVFALASGAPLDKGIPGLFTHAGYHNLFSKRLLEFIHAAQTDDAWVMGNIENRQQPLKAASPSMQNNEDNALTQDIRRQYLEEYTQRWHVFLEDIRTITGASLNFDLIVLRAFAAPDSPLARLARAVAYETTLSQSLILKNAEEKNFFDKASEKLDQKSRDILGVSTKEKQEKTLVDQHFSALREIVTGQADTTEKTVAKNNNSKLGLERIAGLLNDYYTSLVIANTALSSNTLPPTHNEAGMQLKLEGDKLPPPFKAILGALADSGRQKISESIAAILRSQAQQHVDRINSMLAHQVSDICKRSIEGRYPFTASTQDVTIDDFTYVFSAGGAADEFFQKQLAPFVDMSTRPWKYKNPAIASPVSLTEMLALGIPSRTNTTHTSLNTATKEPTLFGELLKLLALQGPNPLNTNLFKGFSCPSSYK